MPSIPAGFIEATFIFQCAGINRDMTWSHGFDFSAFGTTSPSDMAIDIYNEYVGTGNPITAANMIDSYTFVGVQVTKQLEDGPLVGQSLAPIVGTATTDALPPNCCALWSKNTGNGGRRNRGRFFLPVYTPGESSVDAAGVIDSGLRTALQSLYNGFFTGLVTGGYQPVLFHQTAPFTPTEVTSWTLESQIATQRRRMRN